MRSCRPGLANPVEPARVFREVGILLCRREEDGARKRRTAGKPSAFP